MTVENYFGGSAKVLAAQSHFTANSFWGPASVAQKLKSGGCGGLKKTICNKTGWRNNEILWIDQFFVVCPFHLPNFEVLSSELSSIQMVASSICPINVSFEPVVLSTQ